MINKKILFGAFVSIIISGSIYGHEERDFRIGNTPMEHMHKTLSQLDLNKEQKESINFIKSENRQSMQSIIQSIFSLKLQLNELLNTEYVDENAVRRLTVQMAEIKFEQIILRSSIKKEIVKILNDQQKNKLEMMMKKHQKRKFRGFSER